MKILVRGTNWIGDAVMTVPALRELRRIFPEAEIVLHIRRGTADVFAECDYFDRVIAFDAAGSALRQVIRESRLLRKERFDLGILFTNSFESALTQRLAGIPVRFGYKNEGRDLLLSEAVKVPDWKNERHEVYYYLNLVAAVEEKCLGSRTVHDGPPELVISVSDERRKAARDFLAGLGVDRLGKTIALGVGSTNSRAKRWPADRYAALADKLSSETGANIVLVGSAGDSPVAGEVMRQASGNLFDLTGRTSVAEAAAILSITDLMISNDMGLAHLAPATGTPTLVIFGPTNETTTRPFSAAAEIIRKDVECSPCMLRDCPIDHRCMLQVTVEEVFDKAKRILDLHVRD